MHEAVYKTSEMSAQCRHDMRSSDTLYALRNITVYPSLLTFCAIISTPVALILWYVHANFGFSALLASELLAFTAWTRQTD